MNNDINNLDNYFMKPQYIKKIGNIYPIRIKNYIKFIELAGKYIKNGRKYFSNIYNYDRKEYILDFYVKIGRISYNTKDEEITNVIKTYESHLDIMKNNKDLWKQNNYTQEDFDNESKTLEIYKNLKNPIFSILELEQLFSLILRKEIKYKEFNYDEKSDKVNYAFFSDDGESIINKYNFDELREVVMNQNLIFEFPTSPSKQANTMLINAWETLTKNSSETDLIAICSTVSINKNITDEELQNYTWYRLMYDYKNIQRDKSNMALSIASVLAGGCKPTMLCEPIEMHENPFSILFNKYKGNEIDSKLEK